MILTDPNQVLIYGLLFLLGLVIGGFLFAGSGKKWTALYRAEQERNAELERAYKAREKEWREQDSLRAAALKGRDRDGDGVVDRNDRAEFVDRDGDGVDDRDQTRR
jgi:hypothetical protein